MCDNPYYRTITIPAKKLKLIDEFLETGLSNGHLETGLHGGESYTYTVNVCFPDGRVAEINAFTDLEDGSFLVRGMLLRKNGTALRLFERDRFTGEWEFEYNGQTYTVNIVSDGT